MSDTSLITPLEIVLSVATSTIIGWAVWVTKKILTIPKVDSDCLVRIEGKLDNLDSKLDLFKEEVKTYYRTK